MFNCNNFGFKLRYSQFNIWSRRGLITGFKIYRGVNSHCIKPDIFRRTSFLFLLVSLLYLKIKIGVGVGCSRSNNCFIFLLKKNSCAF